MVPLGHTNKAACGVKLLPMTILPRHVHCGCFLCFTQHIADLSLCGGWLTRLWLPTHPPPIELIHDIGVFQKKVSQNPAVLAR